MINDFPLKNIHRYKIEHKRLWLYTAKVYACTMSLTPHFNENGTLLYVNVTAV